MFWFRIDTLIVLIPPWLNCAPLEGLSLRRAHLKMRRKSETLAWVTSLRTWRRAGRWPQPGWTYRGRGSRRQGWGKERASTESLKAASLSLCLGSIGPDLSSPLQPYLKLLSCPVFSMLYFLLLGRLFVHSIIQQQQTTRKDCLWVEF